MEWVERAEEDLLRIGGRDWEVADEALFGAGADMVSEFGGGRLESDRQPCQLIGWGQTQDAGWKGRVGAAVDMRIQAGHDLGRTTEDRL
jgi:hypothetical protein